MIFSEWRQKRREANRFAYFRTTVLADLDYLMGFPGDGQFIERLCRKYPSATAIIEEEFRKDSAVQLTGGRDWEEIPDGPKLRQATQKTVAINLASGIISVELSNLSEGSRQKRLLPLAPAPPVVVAGPAGSG